MNPWLKTSGLFFSFRDEDANPQVGDQATASYCLEPCEDMDTLRTGHPWLPGVKFKIENCLHILYFGMN